MKRGAVKLTADVRVQSSPRAMASGKRPPEASPGPRRHQEASPGLAQLLPTADRTVSRSWKHSPPPPPDVLDPVSVSQTTQEKGS